MNYKNWAIYPLEYFHKGKIIIIFSFPQKCFAPNFLKKQKKTLNIDFNWYFDF